VLYTPIQNIVSVQLSSGDTTQLLMSAMLLIYSFTLMTNITTQDFGFG